jgi:hypothetical protein
VLRWGQADHAWLHFSIVEEATTWPSRIIVAMLQPQDGVRSPVRDAVFNRGGDGFDGLLE